MTRTTEVYSNGYKVTGLPDPLVNDTDKLMSNFEVLFDNDTNRLPLTGGTLTGNLLFTDASYDIGASGATRPRDLFLSRNATVGTTTLAANVAPALVTPNWGNPPSGGWAYGSGTLVKTAGTGTCTMASGTITAGKTYKVAITTSAASIYGINWTLGGVPGSPFTGYALGTTTDYITATTSARLIFTPEVTGSTCTITAITIEEVLTGAVTLGGAVNTFNAPIKLVAGILDNATTPVISLDTQERKLYSTTGKMQLDYSVEFGLSGMAAGKPIENSLFMGQAAGRGATFANNSNFLSMGAGLEATNASGSNFFGVSAGSGATSATGSNFFGYHAGYTATSASYSNFLGAYAGETATGATFSNFIGFYAGYGATGATFSNFLGAYAGNGATSAAFSNFLGNSAGSGATSANYSNFLGQNAGQYATSATYSNFLGYQAGTSATSASHSNFFGWSAGNGATSAAYSNFFGYGAGYGAVNGFNANILGREAGYGATGVYNSNLLGYQAGYGATSAFHCNFLGYHAGLVAAEARESNFIGTSAGSGATNARDSNFIGETAGQGATNAFISNFLGYSAGQGATTAYYSTFIGYSAGYYASNASNSIFIGEKAGYQDTVVNLVGTILTATNVNQGIGYLVNDILTVVGGSVSGTVTVTSATDTVIATHSKNQNGVDYIPTEEVSVQGGNNDAYIIIDTVDGDGGVLTYHFTEYGTGYQPGSDISTVSSSLSGYDFTINILTVSGGLITGSSISAVGRGNTAGTKATTNTSGSGSGATFTITVSTKGTSICIGDYSGTGGCKDSIAIGHGVLNSAATQANIGNVLILNGIYNSDGQSSTPIVPTAGLGIAPSSTAILKLAAGTTGLAPLRLTSGTNATIAVAGNVEYDGTSLYFTRTGTQRETVATVVTKTDAGDGTGAEGLFQINTSDNTFKVYAEGAWRQLTTW
jgi:hypothetical protein